MHAFIAGASGLVGRECLKLLLDRYSSVTALVRRPLNITHARLTERRMEFNKLASIELPAQAHVFCALGTTIKKAGSKEAFLKVDFEYPFALARRAAAAGDARYILVSSVDADPKSRNFYLKTKGELEEAIRGLSLQLHVMRPSFLMGDRAESRPGERLGIVAARTMRFAMLGPLRKYRPISAITVARAMVAAAMSPGAGDHFYHYDKICALSDSLT
jgi:uncharacterized protein YbjT (DUF2867 family)